MCKFPDFIVMDFQDVGHCFGFVEFESADSMNKAVEVCH